jgi:ubiquinone biosynthesis protein Coq4
MNSDQDRAGFEALAQAGADADAARGLGQRLKANPQAADLKALAALWLHGAAAAPESLPGVYDACAEGYLGEPVGARPVPTDAAAAAEPEIIPAAFWLALWALLDEPRAGPGAGGAALNVTSKTAALAGLVAPRLQLRVGKAALAYPGVAAAAGQGYPHRFSLAALARCPPGSLGGTFHALIVDNGFDLEVLDRDALGLDKLPPPLDYLNARILQCHDLWHIVGGYRTTALHEVAISGFQLGQFGHHYSSMFLAMVLTRVAFERPEGGAIMLPTILGAWAHGRRSPPLLGVDWEAVWDKPLDDVRTWLEVTPYASPFPPDLFEQLSAAA